MPPLWSEVSSWWQSYMFVKQDEYRLQKSLWHHSALVTFHCRRFHTRACLWLRSFSHPIPCSGCLKWQQTHCASLLSYYIIVTTDNVSCHFNNSFLMRICDTLSKYWSMLSLHTITLLTILNAQWTMSSLYSLKIFPYIYISTSLLHLLCIRKLQMS